MVYADNPHATFFCMARAFPLHFGLQISVQNVRHGRVEPRYKPCTYALSRVHASAVPDFQEKALSFHATSRASSGSSACVHGTFLQSDGVACLRAGLCRQLVRCALGLGGRVCLLRFRLCLLFGGCFGHLGSFARLPVLVARLLALVLQVLLDEFGPELHAFSGNAP